MAEIKSGAGDDLLDFMMVWVESRAGVQAADASVLAVAGRAAATAAGRVVGVPGHKTLAEIEEGPNSGFSFVGRHDCRNVIDTKFTDFGDAP